MRLLEVYRSILSGSLRYMSDKNWIMAKKQEALLLDSEVATRRVRILGTSVSGNVEDGRIKCGSLSMFFVYHTKSSEPVKLSI